MPRRRRILTAISIELIVGALVIGLISSVFLPVTAARASLSTCERTLTSLTYYERWFGSEHSHTGMDGDDGAAGSTAAQAFATPRTCPTYRACYC